MDIKDQVKNIVQKRIIREGYFTQLTMSARIKPHQNLDETLKKHSYPGFLNCAKTLKTVEDLKYLKDDVYSALPTFEKIRQRIIKCNKMGECKETKSYYKNIQKMYISKGITDKDCELTIKWFKEECIPVINKRIKELSK